MNYIVLDILTLTSVDGTELHPCLTLLGGWWSGLALARTHTRLKKDGVGCAVHILHMWEVAGTTTVVSLPDKLTLPHAVPFVPYWPVRQACDRV